MYRLYIYLHRNEENQRTTYPLEYQCTAFSCAKFLFVKFSSSHWLTMAFIKMETEGAVLGLIQCHDAECRRQGQPSKWAVKPRRRSSPLSCRVHGRGRLLRLRQKGLLGYGTRTGRGARGGHTSRWTWPTDCRRATGRPWSWSRLPWAAHRTAGWVLPRAVALAATTALVASTGSVNLYTALSHCPWPRGPKALKLLLLHAAAGCYGGHNC